MPAVSVPDSEKKERALFDFGLVRSIMGVIVFVVIEVSGTQSARDTVRGTWAKANSGNYSRGLQSCAESDFLGI
jgi:hypothetical protein